MYASPARAPRPLPPSPHDLFPPPGPPENYDSPSHSLPGSSRPSFSNEAPHLPPIAVWDAPPQQDGNLDPQPHNDLNGLASPPASPSVFADGQVRSRRANPLQDLLDSEDQYVQLISAIIRVRTVNIAVMIANSHSPITTQKVASAWSRSNFPPPELDAMFRGIEAVFKANRSFLNASKSAVRPASADVHAETQGNRT
jgi:hypothetical protein